MGFNKREASKFLIQFFVYLNTELAIQNTMTKREYLNRSKYIRDHLTLINRYRSHFIEILGERGVDNLVDQLLDELKYITGEIKKLEENENR